MSFGLRVQSIGERFVVGKHMEWSTFEDVSEVFDGEVHSQQPSRSEGDSISLEGIEL